MATTLEAIEFLSQDKNKEHNKTNLQKKKRNQILSLYWSLHDQDIYFWAWTKFTWNYYTTFGI